MNINFSTTIFFLIAHLSSILSYQFAQIFAGKASRFSFLNNYAINLSVMEQFWLTDVSILFFLLFCFVFNKKIFKEKGIELNLNFLKRNSVFLLICLIVIFSSNCKSYLTDKMYSSQIAIYALLVPLFVFLFLKFLTKTKYNIKTYIALILGFIGFFIAKLDTNAIKTITINKTTIIIALYVFSNVFSECSLFYFAKKTNRFQISFILNIAYVIYGFIALLFYKKFSLFDIIKYSFCPQILIVSVLSFIQHLSIAFANNSIKDIKIITIMDFMKLIITTFLVFVFFNIFPTSKTMIGCFICMCAGLYLKFKKT